MQLFHDSLAVFGVLGIDRELDERERQAGNYQQLLTHQPWYKRLG